jgi:hypothetical protein
MVNRIDYGLTGQIKYRIHKNTGIWKVYENLIPLNIALELALKRYNQSAYMSLGVLIVKNKN